MVELVVENSRRGLGNRLIDKFDNLIINAIIAHGATRAFIAAQHKMDDGAQPQGQRPTIELRMYPGENAISHVMDLIAKELRYGRANSEPYQIYTYRYFLNQWCVDADRPRFCYIAYTCSDTGEVPVGVIVGKMDRHLRGSRLWRGYIAMLSVDMAWRRNGIGARLVQKLIDEMRLFGTDEVVLETEQDNHAALALYERHGFIREKRLYRFYLNGNDAFRLILPLEKPAPKPMPPPQRTCPGYIV